jgi:hypothetical protein
MNAHSSSESERTIQDWFNKANRTNFRAPGGNRSAASVGTITSTYDPRQRQFGFKLLW